MKIIMFNDKYGLTAAVLAEIKKQTRRIINATPKDPKIAYGLEEESGYVHLLDGYTVVAKSRFKVGEVVAVAQPYSYLDGKSDKFLNEWCGAVACDGMNGAGYNNKMFVKAKLMPHRIEITNAALIDKISGKGTWERNPYVFVYNFKLVK